MHMRSMFIAMALVLVVPVVPCAGQGAANPCQREWASGFDLSGTNGTVNAMIEYDDGSGRGPALYVGGEFTEADGVTVNFIARWDGERWSALGDGKPGVNHFVHAMMVFDDGHGPALYVGGQFTSAGGVPASSIARWDGRHWSSVGEGFNGPVYSLIIWGGGNGLNPALYAGGSFGNSGSTVLRNLAKWNPLTSTWSAAGGATASWNGAVRTMAVFADGTGVAPALYLGGDFTIAAGISANYIVKRNNLGWSTLNDTGVPLLNGVGEPVTSLVVFDDDGNGPNPAQLCVGGATHYLGVASGVSRWSGSAWSLLTDTLEGRTSPFRARVLLAVNDPDAPMLLGATRDNGIVARWTGSVWTLVGSSGFADDYQNTQLNAMAMARMRNEASPRLYAGGNFTSGGPCGAANVAQLNQDDWRPLGDGRGQGIWLRALATFDDGSGSGPQIYAGRDYAGVVRLGESNWQVSGQGLWGNVECLAALTIGNSDKPSLFAGGWIYVPPSTSPAGIARFDGRTWEAVGEGLDGSVSAITVFDDGLGDGPVLFAGGSFQRPGAGNPVYVLARWNGRQWQYIGQALLYNSYVNCLAVLDDGSGPALYAGGGFAQATYPRVQKVVRWHPNEAMFIDVGGAMDSPGASDPTFTSPQVHALAVFDDGHGPALYVSGRFTHAGNTVVNHIARWSGPELGWTAVGGGMTSSSCTPCRYVQSLQVLDDARGSALFAGGMFYRAGDASVSHVARWDGQSWTALGEGVDGIVLAMAVLDDADSSNGTGAALYLGGAWITQAGGIASSNIAKWSCAVRCLGDVVPIGGDGVVNIDDLVAVITAWGSCAGCAEDIDGNGVVDIDDLVAVITGWGPCG